MDLGINVTGLTYQAPSSSELLYFADQGFKQIRLSVDWEKIQPSLGGGLDPSYLSTVKTAVAQANALGMSVILDLHNYGQYNGALIGSAAVPVSSFANFWGKLAKQFAGSDVLFGLMNEPQQVTAKDWLPAVNAAIAAIRSTGASQEVLVSGVHWDGGQSWTTTDNAAVLGAPGAIVDPAHNYAFEVHQYLDDTSGQNDWVVSSSIGVERLQQVTDWARQAGAKLVLGEFGVANATLPLSAMKNMLSFVAANGDVWQSADYWAAGALPAGYSYSANPLIGVLDTGQVGVLKAFSGARVSTSTSPDGTSVVTTRTGSGDAPATVDFNDAAGKLQARQLFYQDGNVQQAAVRDKSGGWEVRSYADAKGNALTGIDTYDASLKPTSSLSMNADGSAVEHIWNPATRQTVQDRNFDANGKIASVTTFSSGGEEAVNIKNGVISTIENYSLSWQLNDRLTFDANGNIAQRYWVDSVGNNYFEDYASGTGRPTTLTKYTASWSYVSQTAINQSGGPVGLPTDPLESSQAARIAAVKAGVIIPAPPNGMTIPSLTIASSGGLIGSAAQTISGTGAAGSTVQVHDGSALLGVATVAQGGTWSAAVRLNGDGSHLLIADQVGANGAVASASVTYRLDTTAPAVAIGSAGGIVGASAQHVVGTGEAGAAVQLLDRASTLGTATIGSDGNWAMDVTLSGTGAHQLVARATDAAGNVGASAAVAYDYEVNATPAGTAHTYWGYDANEPGGFNAAFYLANNPDVAAAHVNPLAHYQAYGRNEGRAAYDPGVAAVSAQVAWAADPSRADGFNALYYLDHNPDVAASGMDPLLHYQEFGKNEGRLAHDVGAVVLLGVGVDAQHPIFA